MLRVWPDRILVSIMDLVKTREKRGLERGGAIAGAGKSFVRMDSRFLSGADAFGKL